jgi:hypothetical protein
MKHNKLPKYPINYYMIYLKKIDLFIGLITKNIL